MTDPTAGSLPAGACSRCDRLVVVEWDLDANDELASLCIHCGAPIEVSTHLSLPQAVQHGYVAPGHEPPHGERGCRDGQCGVRQPSS